MACFTANQSAVEMNLSLKCPYLLQEQVPSTIAYDSRPINVVQTKGIVILSRNIPKFIIY
jgi:hypothetical protein